MPKSTSYKDLTRLLRGHGFELRRVPGSHHLFVHEGADTTVLLPADDSARPAMPSQVAAVRRILDERGILAAEAFDEEIRSARNGHPAAGSRR